MSSEVGPGGLDFVIIGAQRAASTYLNACLRDHPDLYLCPDEVPYFEDPFFAHSSPSALEAALAGARPGQRRGIQRPDYLAKAECAERIDAYAPQSRALAVLRDPVARAVSAYFWYVQFGLLPLLPLDVGMERLLDGWTDPAHPRASDILDYGLYGRHLRRYVESLGPERVLALLGEDLAHDGWHRRVYEFLGVDPHHRPPSRPRRHNAGVYDLRRLRVLRARRRFAWSWEGKTAYVHRPRRLRQPLRFLPNAAIVGFDRLVLSRVFTGAAPALRPDLEERLRARYASDLELLEALIGRDLASWRNVRSAAQTNGGLPRSNHGRFPSLGLPGPL